MVLADFHTFVNDGRKNGRAEDVGQEEGDSHGIVVKGVGEVSPFINTQNL